MLSSNNTRTIIFHSSNHEFPVNRQAFSSNTAEEAELKAAAAEAAKHTKDDGTKEALAQLKAAGTDGAPPAPKPGMAHREVMGKTEPSTAATASYIKYGFELLKQNADTAFDKFTSMKKPNAMMVRLSNNSKDIYVIHSLQEYGRSGDDDIPFLTRTAQGKSVVGFLGNQVSSQKLPDAIKFKAVEADTLGPNRHFS